MEFQEILKLAREARETARRATGAAEARRFYAAANALERAAFLIQGGDPDARVRFICKNTLRASGASGASVKAAHPDLCADIVKIIGGQ